MLGKVARKARPSLVGTHRVDGLVLRSLHDPSGGLVGHTALLPGDHRLAKSFLQDVLGQLQIVDTEDAREHREDARGVLLVSAVECCLRVAGCHGAYVAQRTRLGDPPYATHPRHWCTTPPGGHALRCPM